MEFESYIRFFVALVFVLGLIGLVAILARRYGLGIHGPSIRGPKRLALLEVMPLDAKRRVVLLQRDSNQFMVLLGPERDILLEGPFPAPPESAQKETPSRTTSNTDGNTP